MCEDSARLPSVAVTKYVCGRIEALHPAFFFFFPHPHTVTVVEKGQIVFTPFVIKTGRPYKLQKLTNGINCFPITKKAAPWA